MAPPSPPPPPAAALMEDLIEEILVRFPPDEPESLFRASLVCEPWCRVISAPSFRRRYREFHRTPPMLGFFCDSVASDGSCMARFVPKSGFCSPLADRLGRLVDARHGRVLLLRSGRQQVFLVWDPITDEQREIPVPRLTGTHPLHSWKAAVVCGAGACDHLDCHGGAFLVVFVFSNPHETFICTYSSDAGSWSNPISTEQDQDGVDFFLPSVLVGNALYFGFCSMKRALKYDLEIHQLSVVALPSFFGQSVVLTTTQDGWLGLATIHESKLYVWSRKHGPEAAHALWTRDRVIELETLLRSNAAILTEPTVLLGSVERLAVIFLRAGDVLFTVDLKTSKVKKVCDDNTSIQTIIPYMSFYTPDLGGPHRGEGPSAGGSSA